MSVGRSKWDVETPALLVDLAALERNVARMSQTFADARVGWRPHIKAIKVPALADRLIAAGARGVTCATISEAEVMVAAGVQNVLIANQVVGAAKIGRAVDLLRRTDLIVAVDSDRNAHELDIAARTEGVQLSVVIEVDLGTGRAGTQPGEPTIALARRLKSCVGLRFVGVMGWEGGRVAKIPDPDQKRQAVQEAVKLLVDTAAGCRDAGLDVDVVSCGGTGTYWISAYVPGVTEIQAGGGIFCDVYYRKHLGVDHEYALTVLTSVTSRPSAKRIVCDAGKKAMSSDMGLPEPILSCGVRSVTLSAEHAVVELLEDNFDLQVGDKIEFVAGYSDSTVHLHEQMHGIRNDRLEVIWAIPRTNRTVSVSRAFPVLAGPRQVESQDEEGEDTGSGR